MQLEFVIPGHYISKNSVDSEEKGIIRVLGEDPEKPNYFLIQNGSEKSSIPDYQILDNYIYYPTSDTPAEKLVSKNHLFSDFDTITNNDNVIKEPTKNVEFPISYEHKVRTIPEHLLPEQPITKPEIQPLPQPQQSADELFLIGLLDSVKSESIGIIPIELKLQSNFDMSKLHDILKLMPNINLEQLVNILYDTFDLNNIDYQIKSNIANILSKDFVDLNIIKNTVGTLSQTINEKIIDFNLEPIEDMYQPENISEIDEPQIVKSSYIENKLSEHLKSVDKYFQL